MAFAAAKNEFILGHFSAAERQFLALLLNAPSNEDKARVDELLAITQEWIRRGSALVESRELQGSDVLSRRTDQRTPDEIGVLYLSSIAYGLGTGVWLSTLGEADSVAGWVMPPLLLAGAAATTVAVLDRGAGLRYGTAQSIASGMWLGLWQGLAWGGYYQASVTAYDEMSEKGFASLLFATTTAGALTGGLIGTYRATTPGRAAFVGSASVWPAIVLGLGVAAIVPDDQYRGDRALLSSAIGLTTGSVAGMLFAGRVSPTTARVRFLDLGGLAGGLALGGITLAVSGEESGPEATMAMTSLGAVAGLTTAWLLTAGMPKDLGAQSPRQSAVTFVPTVFPQRGGMNLGVAGAF